MLLPKCDTNNYGVKNISKLSDIFKRPFIPWNVLIIWTALQRVANDTNPQAVDVLIFYIAFCYYLFCWSWSCRLGLCKSLPVSWRIYCLYDTLKIEIVDSSGALLTTYSITHITVHTFIAMNTEHFICLFLFLFWHTLFSKRYITFLTFCYLLSYHSPVPMLL